MLETFKSRLKAKSTAAGAQHITNARLDAMSAKLNAKFPDLSDEAEHDAKIDELYDVEMFKEMQALDDFQKGKATRDKQKADKDKADADKTDKSKTGDEPKPGDEEPAWFKSYREKTDAKIEAFEKSKTAGTIDGELEKQLKEIPKSVWSKRVKPDTIEGLEAFITEVKEDYKTDFIDRGLITTAAGGASGKASNGKATNEEIKNIVDGIMPK